MDSIGERIISFRKSSGLTQANVASALGMNRSTYARREPLGDFPAEKVKIMATLFGVTTDEILHGKMNLSPIDQNPRRLNDAEKLFQIEGEEVTLTRTETNFIKIIRQLKKDDYDFLKNFLEEHQ